MHVAPPEDGLDPALKREPPVLPQHGPELAVQALDGVVSCGKGTEPFREAWVHVGEERVLLHERGEGVSRLDQPLVGERGPALVVRGLLL